MSELVEFDNSPMIRAELDIQINTAKAYPRKISDSMANAVDIATMDEETAQSCFYCLPRKDKNGNKVEIKGPSIRLAEIIASNWGNLHAATRIVENDGKHITAEAVAWDLEKNVKVTVQNKVSIIFGAKNGQGGYRANADMQTMLANAASSKALRNAIFKVVPRSVVDKVAEKAMQYAVGNSSKLSSKTRQVVDKLVKMGVDETAILAYFDRAKIDDITLEELQALIGLGTAIKEGYIKPENAFAIEVDKEGDAAETLEKLLQQKKGSNSE